MEGRRIMTRQTSKERLMEEDKKKDEESKTTSVENIEKGEVVVEREKGESRMEEIEIEVDRESVIGQDEESTSRLIQQLEQGKEGEASKAVVVEKESGMEMIMAFMKQELGVFRKEGQESIEKLGDRMDKGQEVLKQVLRNEQLQLNKNIEILTLHVNELEKGIERGIKEVRQDVIQDMDRWGNSLNEKIDKIGDELNEEKSQRDNQLAFMCDNIKRIEEVAAGDRIEIRKEIIVESQNMRQYVDKEIGVNNRKIDKKVNESINVIKGDIDTKIKQLKGNVREEMDQIKGEIGSNIEQFEGKCRDLNAEYSQLRTEVEYRSWGTANGGENQSFINLRCIERESPKFTKIGDRNPKEFIGELEKYLKQCQSQLGPRFNRDVEMGVVKAAMEDQAANWYRIREEEFKSFRDFSREFIKTFWGAKEQGEMRRELYQGRYNNKLGITREEYVLKKVNQFKQLDDLRDNRTIIGVICRQMDMEIAESVIVHDIDDLGRFLNLVKGHDSRDEYRKGAKGNNSNSHVKNGVYYNFENSHRDNRGNNWENGGNNNNFNRPKYGNNNNYDKNRSEGYNNWGRRENNNNNNRGGFGNYTGGRGWNNNYNRGENNRERVGEANERENPERNVNRRINMVSREINDEDRIETVADVHVQNFS